MARRRLKRPPLEKFKQAINETNRVIIKKWHPEYILIKDLIETEETPPDEELEELEYLMSTTPGKVPPIIVFPSENNGKFDIVDGHHRFNAAQRAGLEGLWAIVIDTGWYG